MTSVYAEAHAKINLFLAIRDRRPDGYHDLDMVNVEASLADTLRFEQRASPGIEILCDAPQVPSGPGNLVWKATALLLGECPDPGISIRLEKRIPVGAGLGGGSSDAAAALRTLNRLHGMGRCHNLLDLAKQIGSDVPYSLVGGACRCGGRGERVQPLLPGDTGTPWLYALLILPLIQVRTTDAYRWWDVRGDEDHSMPDDLIAAVRDHDPDGVCRTIHNSFDGVAPRFVPALARWRERVQAETGCEPHLSGSGAALFLVGGDREELMEMRQRLEESYGIGKARYEVTTLLA